MNLATWLYRTAKLDGTCPALLTGDRICSDYGQFARDAAAIAGSLRDRFGIKPGDRIAIFAKNTIDYLEALYGIWWAGAAAVPVNAKLHPKEAAWIVENSGARLVFATAKEAAALAPLLPGQVIELIELESAAFDTLRSGEVLDRPVERSRDNMAWLFYTSGTTGRPKGVMISNGNIHAMVHSYFTDVDTVFPEDAALYAAPISHGAGLYNFQHVLKGARHCVPESGGFDPDEILTLASKLGSVHMFAAPTMVKRLVESAKTTGRDGQGIRTIVYGGGPMYFADIVEAVEVMGPRFCQIYGQGESPMTITALSRDLVADRTHPGWKERLASVGRAQSCVEVIVADETGRELPNGETGEILVRGAAVMKGYWSNEEANASTLRHGWLWTGDMGVFDKDGFLTLKDRSKDLIISGGSNVYPREVEETLLQHPSVSEVSVVGKPDDKWGEIVVAFVVSSPATNADADDLDRFCLENIARFKRPKEYRFADALPKNNYGKVLKTELRAQLASESNKFGTE